MRPFGTIRKVDELGRIVLPSSLRKTFDIQEKDSLEFFTDDDKIILKKYNAGDIFTGEMEDLIEYKGKKISRKTIMELVKLAESSEQ